MGVLLASMVPKLEALLCEVVSFGKTDTPSSEPLRTSGFLSTAPSLSRCLADLCAQASRFTTATAYALTTDLQTLRSCLSEITRATTTGESSPTAGLASAAWDAASVSRSVLLKCGRLAATTAGGLAIGRPADEDSGPVDAGLSPEVEFIALARKPLSGTVAANVQEHGTGGLNVDGCRVGTGAKKWETPRGGIWSTDADAEAALVDNPLGRWPPNVCLDEEAAAMLDGQSGESKSTGGSGVASMRTALAGDVYGRYAGDTLGKNAGGLGDSGGASRFMYVAKASRAGAQLRARGDAGTEDPRQLRRWDTGRPAAHARGLRLRGDGAQLTSNREARRPHALALPPCHAPGRAGAGPVPGLGHDRRSGPPGGLPLPRYRAARRNTWRLPGLRILNAHALTELEEAPKPKPDAPGQGVLGFATD